MRSRVRATVGPSFYWTSILANCIRRLVVVAAQKYRLEVEIYVFFQLVVDVLSRCAVAVQRVKVKPLAIRANHFGSLTMVPRIALHLSWLLVAVYAHAASLSLQNPRFTITSSAATQLRADVYVYSLRRLQCILNVPTLTVSRSRRNQRPSSLVHLTRSNSRFK